MYNEIQLIKHKMNLNNRKMTNHPPSPPPVLSYLIDDWLEPFQLCLADHSTEVVWLRPSNFDLPDRISQHLQL